ncbi:MAG: DUF1932 domain-containing protein [Rhizobiaceae bacterium]|nr:DUF1932 domain-containing protein [Rhizobiaceae bacterium]MCV0407562.1 DUF1932 domain-containing protein [Rhizobiaceae bacterium]
MRIAFIGFGEAARAFADTLRGQGCTFRAYDILTERGADATLREAAVRAGVAVASSPAEAIEAADWVISAVTAADSLDAARSAAPALRRGQVFVDINSVSAGRKKQTAAIVEPSGAAYLDMAVMAPVHPRGHRTPVLVAGPECAAIEPKLKALGFDYTVLGEETGAATSVKMLRSLFVKGLEAVTVQTLLAARAAGRFDEVYASLSNSYPQLGWPDFALYQLDRVATHGVRRAAEMRESAATMAELGLETGRGLAEAIAELQQTIGEIGWRDARPREPAEAFADMARRLTHRSL